jgi:hypothetical protein
MAVDLDILVGRFHAPASARRRRLGFRQGLQQRGISIERPAQVDRRGPGGVSGTPRRRPDGVRGIERASPGHAIGGGRADQRRAAHAHFHDRVGEILQRVHLLDAEIVRQPALVDDLQRRRRRPTKASGNGCR